MSAHRWWMNVHSEHHAPPANESPPPPTTMMNKRRGISPVSTCAPKPTAKA